MQAWTLILISSTTRLLKKQVEGTWSLVGLPVQVFQLCAIALSQVTHPLSLTNDKPGRWISDQWEEGSNKLCMCSNNNATQTGWRIGRVHRCLQNLPEYNPNGIFDQAFFVVWHSPRLVATYSRSHKAIENQSKQRHTSSFLVFTKCTISKNALTLKVQRR